MIASAREVYIINRLNELGIIDYKSIAAELLISEATVRRDFEKLAKQGKLRRVQGGAMRSGEDETGVTELTMRSKKSLNSAEKAAVAARAAEFVQDGECVFLDAGTSIAPIADHLAKKRVQVVTYSSLVLQRLAHSRCALFMVGGQYDAADNIFVGALAEKQLAEFRFDHAFIGCTGVDVKNDTVFVTEIKDLRMKQIAMENASRKYLLVDASKFNKRGLVRVCGLSVFDKVICSSYPDGEAPDNFIVAGMAAERRTDDEDK